MTAPLSFADPRRRARRPSLTPMIDVVFLLLVFFMLVSRFGAEAALPVAAPGGGEGWRGAPRLVDIGPASVALNGVAMVEADLAAAVARLIASPGDPVILRGRNGADLQRVLDVAEALSAAGIGALVLAE